MNKCTAVRDLLALRPDDWEAEERIRIEEHLETCADCAAFAGIIVEQDRLMVDLPGLRLTPVQREKLMARIQREGRRREVRMTFFSALGTATVIVVLAAFTLALYLLFGVEEPQTTGSMPVPSVTPTAEMPTATVDAAFTTPTPASGATIAPSFPVFAGEIRINGLVLQASAGESSGFGLDEYSVENLPLLDTFTMPITLGVRLRWQLIAAPSADWMAFVHLLDEAGELAKSSDVAVEWPEQSCPEDTYDSLCVAKSEIEWSFSSDFPAGLYVLVAGLYDRGSGQRAPVTYPEKMSQPQIALGRVHMASDESVYGGAPVTLRIFSGRPNPVWLLSPEQEAEFTGHPGAADVFRSTPRRHSWLGLFWVLCADCPILMEQHHTPWTIWKGVVRLEAGDEIQVLADSGRVLERWLLETGVGEVEDSLLEIARAESVIPTPLPEGRVEIYLTASETTPEMLLGGDLDALVLEQEPILSEEDMLFYSGDTHEIHLTPFASERLNQLGVPLTGRGFVVVVGHQRIYSGAFWTPASSVSFPGVVIRVPLLDETLRIQLGYPESLDLFQGEDPRADGRIWQSLEASGKLQ